MMKRIFLSVLTFMFTWVAVGAIDCGCAFAGTNQVSEQKIIQKEESGGHCHSAAEAQAKPDKEACCSGCQLENKAPLPVSVQITAPLVNKFSEIFSGHEAFGAATLSNLTLKISQINYWYAEHTRRVSFFDTPIYLAVQSFLI